MKSRKILLGVVTVVVPIAFLLYPAFPAAYMALTGCVTPQAAPLASVPDYNKDLFSFPKFNLPGAKKAGSVDLTVVNIIPEYKDTQNRDREYTSGEKVTAIGTRGAMTKDMTKVFKSFAGSAGEDIEAQLVAKGMTTKGPFDRDEVTYPDKKNSDLMVVMQLIFDIQYTDAKFIREETFEGGREGKIYTGTMSVGLKVYYYLLEPLSEEKMWVKKLDLGTQEFSYEYALQQEQYATGTRFVSDGCGGGYNVTDYAWRDTNAFVYDSRAKIFSGVLQGAYPQLMQTAWKYFDSEEMLGLRDKSKEIRAKWGSSSFRRGAPD